MARSGIQTIFGKAFECACVRAAYDRYSKTQEVVVLRSDQMATVNRCYDILDVSQQSDLYNAAAAAVRVLDRLEPRLRFPDNDEPLYLSVQSDAAGIAGDVRDVLCIRRGHDWEIGLSCKHNHHAVKHSRLSDTIDFGEEWFGYPCSLEYFNRVVPVFSQLRKLRDLGKMRGQPILWASIEDKYERFYEPILEAFMDELRYLNSRYPDVPEKLIRYLMGRNDFYKVITDDRRRVTRVEAINLEGSLNSRSEGHAAITTVPVLKMPTRFYHVDFKEDMGERSQTTIYVALDRGWEISMRLHNASSRVEPSLKFDVQLVSLPSTVYAQVEPWDYC